jgi:hypothetical protein
MGAIDKVLKITILGDSTQLKQTYDEATKAGQRFGKEVEKHGVSLKAVGTVMTAVGGTIVGAMTATVVAVANSAGKILDLANAAGVSAETFQKLASSARQDGVEQEQLSAGLTKLIKNMGDARKGTGDAAEAFHEMKIGITDVHGKLLPVETVLPKISDHFKNMKDPTEKANLAMTLFGKTGTQFVAWLSQGSAGMKAYADEAQKLGIIMSNETVAALDEFSDNLGTLKAGFGGLGNEIAADLVPGLQMLTNGLKSGLEMLNSIPGPVKQVIVVGTALAGVVALVAGGAIALGTAFAAATIPIWPFIAGAAALGAIATVVYNNWDYVASFFMTVWDKAAEATQIAWSSIKAYVYTYIDLILKGLNVLTGFIPGWGDKLKKAMVTLEADRHKEIQNIQNNAQKLQQNSFSDHLKAMQSSHKKATTEMTEEEKQQQELRLKDQKDAQEKAEKLQKEWADKLFNETHTELEKLNKEEQEALNQTGLTEKAKSDIRAYYAKKRSDLEKETADKQQQIIQSATQKYEDTIESNLNDIMRNEKKSQNDRLRAANQYYQLQQSRLKATYNREVKEAKGNYTALEALGKTYYAQSEKLESDHHETLNGIVNAGNQEQLQSNAEYLVNLANALGEGQDSAKDFLKNTLLAQFSADEVKVVQQALSGISIATSLAPETFGASLAWIPGITSSWAAAIAEIEVAKAVVRGLADGGLTTGPSINLIGEGKYPEAVLPLDPSKLKMIGDQILQASQTTNNNSSVNNNSSSNSTNNFYFNGGLIGDDLSLKKLTRKITDVQTAERKRKGG